MYRQSLILPFQKSLLRNGAIYIYSHAGIKVRKCIALSIADLRDRHQQLRPCAEAVI